jgi:tetratricopeptide (TPR) repeat protein
LNRCPGCNTPIRPAVAIGVLTPLPTAALPGPEPGSPARPGSNHTTQFDDDQTTEFPVNPPVGVPSALEAPSLKLRFTTVNSDVTMIPGAGPSASDAGNPVPPVTPVTSGDSGPLSPGQNFGWRYRILALLGVGGMGAVYQAWDAELGVAVAIKVIRTEIMADPAASAEVERRFKRELLLARQVTHKNVVRIHDLGEIDGIKYITMPYVEGTDLASLLRREGVLPVATVLRIARSIVAGLVAAHAAGVVHRDLKPANIMVDRDGEALVMDFGIANSTAHAAGVHATSGTGGPPPGPIVQGLIHEETNHGAIVGTVAYMAPEQARGESVDQRADVYALGLIIYDMLAGRRRSEKGDSASAELQGRMKQAPPALASVVPDVPAPVDRIVSKCLEPDPKLRYQTSHELAADLDRLDADGELIPVKRVVGLPLVGTALVALLLVFAGAWWFSRPAPPAAEHEPVSVLIADFQNGTGDPAFDRTMEPVMKMALEGAGFITAYDRTTVRRTIGVAPPETLTEQSAQELAVKSGLGVVVSGSIVPGGRGGYDVTIKAAQAVTGTVMSTATDRAASKDKVLTVATELASVVRKALGDDTSDSAQRFAMETLTTTSLEVVRAYAIAMQAMSDSRFEEARQEFGKALAADPGFGLASAGMAMASRNLGQQDAAEQHIKEAVRHVDRMTERERYRTRGLFYLITGDYQACVKEYGDLIARYAGDVTAHNNLALCSTHLRDMPRALDEMRHVVEILPKRALYRVNLALYAAYAGDFATGDAEGRVAQELGSPLGLLPLAFAQVAQGQLTEAAATYQSFGSRSPAGASYMASGLGDIAVFSGRYADAAQILAAGADADLKTGELERAAAKFAALAYTRVLQGRNELANAAAEKALANSRAAKIRFLAARVFVETGSASPAQTLGTGLAAELQAEPQALGLIIAGDAALKAGEFRQAIKSLSDANALLDTWIGHVDLGRAYLAAGAFPQADSEFDRALTRRGEALAMFMDEEPTYGFLPQVYYYQGRVREELKSAGFAESYQTYLDMRAAAGEDRLIADVRRRLKP